MKKFIYSIFAVLALSCTLVACGDDKDENISYSTTAEKGSEGTYTGTWTRTSDSGVETFEGSVALAAGASTGVTNVTFTCAGFSLDAASVANIWHSGHGYQFVNQVSENNADNKLGSAFSGAIDADGNLNVAFTVSQRSGRVQVQYKYEFVGKK